MSAVRSRHIGKNIGHELYTAISIFIVDSFDYHNINCDDYQLHYVMQLLGE